MCPFAGTELVSPDDLLAAVKLFKQVRAQTSYLSRCVLEGAYRTRGSLAVLASSVFALTGPWDTSPLLSRPTPALPHTNAKQAHCPLPPVPQAGLPLSLRTFGSGLVAVQSGQHSDDAVCGRIRDLTQPQALSFAQPLPSSAQQQLSLTSVDGGDFQQQQEQEEQAAQAARERQLGAALGSLQLRHSPSSATLAASILASLGPSITASDVARALGVATSVASEHLLLAEARGVVCRDEGPEGLRFFRNFFPTATFTSAA